MGKNLIKKKYIVATALKSCFIKIKRKNNFLTQKQATTHDFLVENRECNTQRGLIDSVYMYWDVVITFKFQFPFHNCNFRSTKA